MRSASLSRDGKALGGKSVLVTAKGILNRLPSELTATLPMGADGAALRAIELCVWARRQTGAEIAGCLMGGGATAGDAVGAGGAFTGFGVARALGGAIADLGSAGGGATGVGAFRIAATFGTDGGLGRFTAGAFGAAGTREATFGGSINFDFGRRRPNTWCFRPGGWVFDLGEPLFPRNRSRRRR